MIRTHVGYGIQPILIERLQQHNVSDVPAALARFTEYYFERCVQETVLYDGVAELLPRLSGYQKVILTNKSTRFIGKILTGLGLNDHFVGQYGRESFAKTKPDPLPILSILRKYEVAPHRALMIGDTETDVNAGRNAEVPTCLVTYGYGKPAVLETLEPTFTIAKIADLLPIVDAARVET